MTLFEPLTSTSPICDIHTLYSKLFVITTKQYSIPSCKYIGESNVNVVALVPVVESTFTSSGFKTFLPNGRSFEAGYPFNTLRTSTQTGSTSSFREK